MPIRSTHATAAEHGARSQSPCCKANENQVEDARRHGGIFHLFRYGCIRAGGRISGKPGAPHGGR